MESAVREKAAGLRAGPDGLIRKNWSAGFEEEPYPSQPDLILEDSLYAIAATRPVDEQETPFVNLVTPGELGDPVGYLIPALMERLGDSIRLKQIGQCGCGGFVVRVWRLW